MKTVAEDFRTREVFNLLLAKACANVPSTAAK